MQGPRIGPKIEEMPRFVCEFRGDLNGRRFNAGFSAILDPDRARTKNQDRGKEAPMRIERNVAIDNCYIRISDAPAEQARILAPHLAVDLDHEGNVVGWDVHDASANEDLIHFLQHAPAESTLVEMVARNEARQAA
jgi:uncharacterized protein YuzE